jgi:hypothetical protein
LGAVPSPRDLLGDPSILGKYDLFLKRASGDVIGRRGWCGPVVGMALTGKLLFGRAVGEFGWYAVLDTFGCCEKAIGACNKSCTVTNFYHKILNTLGQKMVGA